MKITVNKVVNNYIFFSSEYGKGKGIWKGNNIPVEKGYFVEFDINEIYSYDDFRIANSNEYQIQISEEKIRFTLLLLDYDEWGCATFKFGDSLIEVETDYDERFYSLKNLYIILVVKELDIYDENI